MSVRRVLSSIALCVTVGATSAMAQYGPYGSPELIRMPQAATPGYGVVRTSAYQEVQPPAPPMPEGGAPLVVPQEMQPAAPTPSVVDQMLQQADPSKNAPSRLSAPCTGGCYGEAINDGDCGSYDVGCSMASDCCKPWFASARGLVMGRNNTDNVWLSYEWGNEVNQCLKTNDAEYDWEGGFEVTLGRRFCCAGVGFEVTYWMLGNFEGSASAYNVGSPIQTGLVELDDPDPTWTGPDTAIGFIDQAQEHCIHRESEIYNLEANLFSTRLIDPCSSPLALDWVAGIRWMHFGEDLTWDALAPLSWDPNIVWGYDNGRYQLRLQDEVTNDLIGFQFGFNADLYLGHRVKLFAAPKFGIYNNHIRHEMQIYRGDGLTAAGYDNQGAMLGTFPVCSTEDVLSFITEIDLGTEVKITHNLSATVGYRVVVATDVAMSDYQIPFYLNDIAEIEAIDSNNDLILHGAFAGLNFSF